MWPAGVQLQQLPHPTLYSQPPHTRTVPAALARAVVDASKYFLAKLCATFDLVMLSTWLADI